MLKSMGSKIVGHKLMTEQQQQTAVIYIYIFFLQLYFKKLLLFCLVLCWNAFLRY